MGVVGPMGAGRPRAGRRVRAGRAAPRLGRSKVATDARETCWMAGSGHRESGESAMQARANAELAIPYRMTGGGHRTPANPNRMTGSGHRCLRARTGFAGRAHCPPASSHRTSASAAPSALRRTADRSRAILRTPPSGFRVQPLGQCHSLAFSQGCPARPWARVDGQTLHCSPASLNHTAASAEPCSLCRAQPRPCARRSRVLATRAQPLGRSCPLAPFYRGALHDREPVWTDRRCTVRPQAGITRPQALSPYALR